MVVDRRLTMTTIKGLVLAGFLAMATGCAGAGGGISQRGTVLVQTGSVRAFASGPAVVHAYSQDHGGAVFTAHVVTGTDADCARTPDAGSSALPADRVEVVMLAQGQIACVRTQGQRRYELLWHAREASPGAPAVAVAHN